MVEYAKGMPTVCEGYAYSMRRVCLRYAKCITEKGKKKPYQSLAGLPEIMVKFNVFFTLLDSNVNYTLRFLTCNTVCIDISNLHATILEVCLNCIATTL